MLSDQRPGRRVSAYRILPKAHWIIEGSEAFFSRNMRENACSLVGRLIGFDHSPLGDAKKVSQGLIWEMSDDCSSELFANCVCSGDLLRHPRLEAAGNVFFATSNPRGMPPQLPPPAGNGFTDVKQTPSVFPPLLGRGSVGDKSTRLPEAPFTRACARRLTSSGGAADDGSLGKTRTRP